MSLEYYFSIDLNEFPDEKWIDVNNYEGLYQISNLGRIKRLRRIVSIRRKDGSFIPEVLDEQIVCQTISTSGFLKVILKDKNRTRKTFFVHKLMGSHFLGNAPRYGKLRHRNGNKFKNSADNLEWYVPKYRIKQQNEEFNIIKQEERIFV